MYATIGRKYVKISNTSLPLLLYVLDCGRVNEPLKDFRYQFPCAHSEPYPRAPPIEAHGEGAAEETYGGLLLNMLQTLVLLRRAMPPPPRRRYHFVSNNLWGGVVGI